MNGVVGLPLDLEVIDCGLGAYPELGHGVPLQTSQAKARETLDQGERTFRLGDHDDPGEDRGRLAGPVELDHVDRLVEREALADAQGSAPGHQGSVQRDHGIVVTRVHGAKCLLEPRRRLLERLGERHDLDPGSLEPRDVGKIGPKLALDHDQAIGGKLCDARAERFLDVGGIDRQRGGADRRIDFGQQRAEVGIFPGFDAAMRQPKSGISLDRLVPQARRRRHRLRREAPRGRSRTCRDKPARPWCGTAGPATPSCAFRPPCRRIRRSPSVRARAQAQARPSAPRARPRAHARGPERCNPAAADNG